MLPHVIRYNAENVGCLYGELAEEAGLCDATGPEAPALLAGFVRELVGLSGSPTSLAECDVDPQLVPTLAEEAAAQWTGQFNPRPVDVAALKELYECAFSEDTGST